MNINQIPKIKHADSGNFFLIAGPCAIESEELAIEIALRVFDFWYLVDIHFYCF